jgi:Protein of unknown function (DUF2874).
MKNKLVIVLLVLFSTYAMAQGKKGNSKESPTVTVPELVKKEFAKKYPSVTNVKWSLEKAGEYEAEFNMNKKGMSVVIDEKGNLLEVETEIKVTELPQAINATIAKDFPGYKINECEKIEAKGIVSYELEVQKEKIEYEIVLNADGKLLKKVAKKEKDKD